MAKKRSEKSLFSFHRRKPSESQSESWPLSTTGSAISTSVRSHNLLSFDDLSCRLQTLGPPSTSIFF
ncbi:hypothetical protein PISMIDRAFT_686048 [Pisolithus microcarpus 441]|uniref:Uncharacterized protein n=1 Tax=Pisolithus microcarpus 441 TaxID=765257 RepID=A0A0C9XQB1_9AGAM|nr:hypothetical protein PISMIDRAFT_687939 [Pisolithus microcarpus 441]KIK16689.1 hypothetical protein PISMIDRAFT_686048 [Pisolithus microcarpus 441]